MVFADPCAGTYGAPPLNVPAPAILPWRFGLLSVANVIDETDDHARNGIFYKSPACTGTVTEWVDDCDSDLVDPKSPTGPDDTAYIQGCPFHLYAALNCKTTTLAAMGEEVLRVFELDEQRAVEAAVWANVLATPAATVLNASSLPADAFPIVGGIAALESAMAECYGGRATFHADRGVAPYFARDFQVHTEGSAKFSELGSAVAFYGGSPNTSPAGVVAPAGFAWIYATSTLTLRRFPIDVLPETDQRLQYSPLTNEPFVLAERTYVPSVECCTYAVLVSLSDCGCTA